MKRLIALTLLMCLLSTASFAEIESTTPTAPPQPKEVAFVLHKENNKTLRAPSNNFDIQIEGTYNADGVLSVFISDSYKWGLTIETNEGTYTYATSSEELTEGINIGKHTSFTILLSDDSGELFVGNVNIL